MGEEGFGVGLASWLLLQSISAAVIGPAGGTLALPGYGQVAFPAGSFAARQRVELLISRSEEIAQVFEVTVPVYPIARAEWEVTIRTGTACPARRVRVVLRVPTSLKVPPRQTPTVFALTFQAGGEDVLDGFENVTTSRYAERTRTVTADLPAEAFTSLRRADHACEAVLVLGTAPLT